MSSYECNSTDAFVRFSLFTLAEAPWRQAGAFRNDWEKALVERRGKPGLLGALEASRQGRSSNWLICSKSSGVSVPLAWRKRKSPSSTL